MALSLGGFLIGVGEIINHPMDRFYGGFYSKIGTGRVWRDWGVVCWILGLSSVVVGVVMWVL
jgi:hypothetical protein